MHSPEHLVKLRCADARAHFPHAGCAAAFPFSELVLVAIGFAGLLAAEALLCAAILGTNYYGFDGKMAQATILAAFKFGAPFSINDLNPIEGVGSQLLPMNVWANPAYWPFALVDKELATDLSAIIALGIFAIACYLMARCFDVPMLPSILAAQSTIVLFAPAVLILHMPTVFCLTPGNAVVYAPHMVALGMLGAPRARTVAQYGTRDCRHRGIAALQPLLRPVVDNGQWHELGAAVRGRYVRGAAVESDRGAMRGARVLLGAARRQRRGGIHLHAVAIHLAGAIPIGTRSWARPWAGLGAFLLARHEDVLCGVHIGLADRSCRISRPAACPGRCGFHHIPGLGCIQRGVPADLEQAVGPTASHLCRALPVSALSRFCRRGLLGRLACLSGLGPSRF